MNGRSLGCLCLSAQTQKLFPACLWQLVSREVLNFRKADPCPVAHYFLSVPRVAQVPEISGATSLCQTHYYGCGQEAGGWTEGNSSSVLQKRTFEGQSGCQLKQCLGLLFPCFLTNEMGLLNLLELLEVVVSMTTLRSSLSAACLNYLGMALFAEQCQNQLLP